MKFVHITFRFEYTDRIDKILDENGIIDYVTYPMVQGGGQDGKHMGSKVYPGNFTVVQALVDDEKTGPLFDDLEAFRTEKSSRQHLRAVIMHVEAALGAKSS